MFDLLDFICTILKSSQKDFILNTKSENILPLSFVCYGMLGTFYQNVKKKKMEKGLVSLIKKLLLYVLNPALAFGVDYLLRRFCLYRASKKLLLKSVTSFTGRNGRMSPV